MNFAPIKPGTGQPEVKELSVPAQQLEVVISGNQAAFQSLVACPWITTPVAPNEQQLIEAVLPLVGGARPGAAVLISGGRSSFGEPELNLYLVEGQNCRIVSIRSGDRPAAFSVPMEMLPPDRREELNAFLGVALGPATMPGIAVTTQQQAPQLVPIPPDQSSSQQQAQQAAQAQAAATAQVQQMSFVEFEQRVLSRESSVMERYKQFIQAYEQASLEERYNLRVELDLHCSASAAHLPKDTPHARYAQELVALSLDRAESAISIQTKLIADLDRSDKRIRDQRLGEETMDPIIVFFQALSKQRRRLLLKELQELERCVQQGTIPSEDLEFRNHLEGYYQLLVSCRDQNVSMTADLYVALRNINEDLDLGPELEQTIQRTKVQRDSARELKPPSEDDASAVLFSIFQQLVNWNKRRGERGYVDGKVAHGVRIRLAALFGFNPGSLEDPELEVSFTELRGGKGYSLTLRDASGGTTNLIWHPHLRSLTMSSTHPELSEGFSRALLSPDEHQAVTLPEPFEQLGRFLTMGDIRLRRVPDGIEVILPHEAHQIAVHPERMIAARYRNQVVAHLFELVPLLKEKVARFAQQHRAVIEAVRKRPLAAAEQAQVLRGMLELFHLTGERRNFGLRMGLGFGPDKPVVTELVMDGEPLFRLQYLAPDRAVTIAPLSS